MRDFTRLRERGKYDEPATVKGLPADLVKKGQAREMKDLDVRESTVPKDAKILDCG